MKTVWDFISQMGFYKKKKKTQIIQPNRTGCLSVLAGLLPFILQTHGFYRTNKKEMRFFSFDM